MMTKNTYIFLVALSLCLCLSTVLANKKEFPGRDLYPNVSYIKLGDLEAKFKDVLIVDVRSQYEYKTLRIKGAMNIPLSSGTFVTRMRELRKNDARPIVVYCNGKTCMKSYKAARKCKISDIADVTAYDAGIMDWAKAYPGQAQLLGKDLLDPSKLISKKLFKTHLITPEQFENRIADSNDIVIDVRDRFQREGISMFVGREHRVRLDDRSRLKMYIDKAKREGKGLLIYDAAGKQVRWLQYYLQAMGLKKYYFMKGGIRGYFEWMKEDFNT